MHVVKFNPVSESAENFVPHPQPARKYIPKWYREMNAFYDKKPFFENDGTHNGTVKMCVPFRDTLVSGYIQESWQDINITKNNQGEIFYAYPTYPDIMSPRGKYSIPIDTDIFNEQEFVFHSQWAPELPRGWSMLFTSPLNHYDLPFFVPSGIIDSDRLTQYGSLSKIPFYVKKNFEGVIPRGTPLYQMIPIKRSKWVSIKNNFDDFKRNKIQYKVRSHIWGGYKKEYWQKKEYA